MFNPVVTFRDQSTTEREGCMSVPDLTGRWCTFPLNIGCAGLSMRRETSYASRRRGNVRRPQGALCGRGKREFDHYNRWSPGSLSLIVEGLFAGIQSATVDIKDGRSLTRIVLGECIRPLRARDDARGGNAYLPSKPHGPRWISGKSLGESLRNPNPKD